ncbi:MAG: glycosyltransferase family 4 protein [Bacteroidota bacterium]
MNVLLLTNQGGLAGSTQSIAYLAKGLAENGHSVVVGCRASVWLREALQNSSVIWREVRFKGQFDLKSMQAIRQIVEEFDIQIINSQTAKAGRVAAFTRWRYSLKSILLITRRQYPHPKAKWVRGLSLRLIADKVITVSEGVKAGILAMGVPEKKVTVIENGTPATKYDLPDLEKRVEKLRKKYQIDETSFVIGCVARRKSQEQLLETLKYLDFAVTVVFIGIEDTDEFRAIRETYTQAHRVIFLGKVPIQETLYHYPLFSVKVLPSLIEGLSQSLLEAMAMGVPVVATRAGGNPNLIRDNENGLLFDDQDTQLLAQHLKNLHQNHELRHKLTEAGKQTALEDFSIKKVISRYEDLFTTLLSEK